jgi:hypothetical protein
MTARRWLSCVIIYRHQNRLLAGAFPPFMAEKYRGHCIPVRGMDDADPVIISASPTSFLTLSPQFGQQFCRQSSDIPNHPHHEQYAG